MRTGGLFWKALERARRSNLAASGEAMPRRGTSGITRRRVIAAMAASAAALPLAACDPLPSFARRSRVAIIGGGLAGLEALRRLKAAGVDARLYEARGRLGGRIFTARSGPVPADDGGQFVNSDHADMLELAQTYGLQYIDRGQMMGRSLAIDGGRVVGEAELARQLQGIAARIAADSAALDADYEAGAARLDAFSVSQYLDSHADALPEAWVRRLLEAGVRTEYGQEPQHASALELVFNLPVADGSHIALIGSSDEQFVLAGGSGSLIDAMAPDLMPHIETGMALTALRQTQDGVRLHFAHGETAEADRVIVTVPAPLMRTIDYGNLLPPLWRQYMGEIGCGRNEKLNAAYHDRPWLGAMGMAGDIWPLQGGFAEGWDATTVEGDTGLFTYYMGGAQCDALKTGDAASLRQRFEAEAALALPGLGEASAQWQRRTRWGADPFARGAYSCFRPGQLTRFASLFWLEGGGTPGQIPAAGPVIFAGEHLSDAWPGYMNGGAQTGRLAAEALLGEA